MKSLAIFLISFYFLSSESEGYKLVYTDYYITQETNKIIPTVIAQRGDSIRTYIDGHGYVWWKIDTEWDIHYDKHINIILSGKYKLSYKEHHSLLYIYTEKVVQLVYLEGTPPLVFSIEMGVKTNLKKKQNGGYNSGTNTK